MNVKGLYDTYQCEVCMNEDESQKHIYRCPEILRIRNIKFDEIPDNEKNHKWECKRKVRNFKNLWRKFENPWRIYWLQVNGAK